MCCTCLLSGEERTLATRLAQLSSYYLLCVEDIIGSECCLGIVCHHFQWIISVSKTLQAVRIRPKELFRSKNPPLNYVDEFMKVDRLISLLVPHYEKSIQIRDAAEIAALEVAKPSQPP